MLPYIKKLSTRRRLERLAAFATPQVLTLEDARRVLVFSPHPDDETIGCGGTLICLAQRCEVTVVLVTDGSGGQAVTDDLSSRRQSEFRHATATLGINSLEFLHEPDGELSINRELRLHLSQLLEKHRPNWVFLPSPLEAHRDHVRLSAMLTPLCRGAASVERIIFYEVWSPLPATHLVDITDQVDQKQAALAEHATALIYGDYARAVDGLNRYRGVHFGHNRWAEAFLVETADEAGYFSRLLDLGLDLYR